MMGLWSRIRDGPLEDSGDWEDAWSEYRTELMQHNDVDVRLDRYYGPPTGGGTRLDGMNEESVPGLDAWEAVDEYIRDEELDEYGIEDIPFEYELRGRGDEDVLTLEGGTRFLGHTTIYRVRFEF